MLCPSGSPPTKLSVVAPPLASARGCVPDRADRAPGDQRAFGDPAGQFEGAGAHHARDDDITKPDVHKITAAGAALPAHLSVLRTPRCLLAISGPAVAPYVVQAATKDACLTLRTMADIYPGLPYDEYVLVDDTTPTAPAVVWEDNFRSNTDCATQRSQGVGLRPVRGRSPQRRRRRPVRPPGLRRKLRDQTPVEEPERLAEVHAKDSIPPGGLDRHRGSADTTSSRRTSGRGAPDTAPSPEREER